MSSVAARMDDFGKPAWIMLMVLSFVTFWPLGLAVLAFLIGSGRFAAWKCAKRWRRMEGMQMGGGFGNGWCRGGRHASSGNHAFDEYRDETLRRLEEEQREFREFLDRLRQAKDKAEFDQFMADRSRREGPSPQPAS